MMAHPQTVERMPAHTIHVEADRHGADACIKRQPERSRSRMYSMYVAAYDGFVIEWKRSDGRLLMLMIDGRFHSMWSARCPSC